MPFRDGLQFDANGVLYTTPRNGRVPTTALYRDGWARDVNGYAYVESAGSAVPSGAQYRNGMAFTDDGALYVTNSTPTAPQYRGGKAIRADGALHITLLGAGTQYHGGWARNSTGNACVSVDHLQGSAAAQYKYQTGITVTGSGVSTWADQSGNGRDLLQGTDAARPPLQADNSILFDGVADFLSVAFTLVQPATIYVLGKQITWTNNDIWFDGVAGNRMGVTQSATTPNIRCFAGASTLENNGLALNTYGVIAGLFNGANSGAFVNNAGPALSDAGAGNGGGIILGSSNTFGFSNIQVKEVIVFSSAHDATTRAAVIAYLNIVGGL